MAKIKWIYAGTAITASAVVLFVAYFSSQATETLPPLETHGTATTIEATQPKLEPGNAGTTEPTGQGSHTSGTMEPDEETTKKAALTTIETDESEGEETILTSDGKRYPLRTYEPLATPNDPDADQWWVGGTGLDTAWNYPAGPYETLVAVIDTGFALQHEEFQNRWHSNVDEQGLVAEEASSNLNCTDQGIALDKSCNNIDDDFDGIVDNEAGNTTLENPSDLNCTDQGVSLDKACNNIDDDGNGLADDVRGWDFSSFDASVQAGQTNPNGDGTQHGTMVSGILGATGNNGAGIAGVNWNTKILPIQALNDDSYGNTLTVARGVRYAAQQGADIISVSLGAGAEDPYLREAVHYALEQGSVVVAASGNDGCDCITYPARYPEVLAVGASTQQHEPAGFNSYGSMLDLLAPGQDMTTASWLESAPTDAYVSGVSGTSFATPYVSGVLAHARSHQPEASWGELVATLLKEADHDVLTASSPRSSTLGFGYARADNLLARITTPATTEWRHNFGPLTQTDTLESARSYQCKNGEHPTMPLYALSRSGKVRYTTSQLALYNAQQDGWTDKLLTYTCSGLPGDNISSLRVINLLSEIYNKPFQKL